MPSLERIKTKYRGVYYVIGRSLKYLDKKERIYYIRYRRDGRDIEEKAGRQFQESMTAAKAAKIRSAIIAGTQPSRKKGREKCNAKAAGRQAPIKKKETNLELLKEKWLLFTESATDGFGLMDSDLNLLEVNEAAMRFYPPGTRKRDIIGRNLLEIVPEKMVRDEYKKFREVIETGKPFVADDVVLLPSIFGNRRFKYKAFKVGDELGMIITDITDRKHKEEQLRKREAELEAKTLNLEEANIALKVLLKKNDQDREELGKSVLFSIKELAGPYIEKLKNTKLDDSQRAYLDIIKSSLNDVASPFVRKVSALHLGLTNTEIQVANLVKHGKPTKEIADLMHLSGATIDFYRKKIRKKLGISNRKINLRTYLTSIK